MDLSGWIPPEAYAILILGSLVAGWVLYRVGDFVLAHVSIVLH